MLRNAAAGDQPRHVATPLGQAVKVTAEGLRSGQVYKFVLDDAQLARLDASPDAEPFDGDPQRFRLGAEVRGCSLTTATGSRP